MKVVGWKGALLPWVVLFASAVLAVVVLHPEVALQGKIYHSSDAEGAQGFRAVGDAQQAAGEYPLWNPYVFGGMPSFASLAYTPGVYPLAQPIRVVRDAVGGPPMSWLLVHLVLAGFFTAAYARWRGMSLAAAAFAGVLIVSLPKLAAWSAYGHGTKVGTFAWTPLVLWGVDAVVRRGRWSMVFALGIAVSMLLLRAHVQIIYYTAMAVVAWVGFQLLADLKQPELRPRTAARVGKLAVAGAVAFGTALVLYLPILQYQSHSVRGSQSQGGGAGFEYATNWSLATSEIETLWWPTAAGYGRGSYVGQMPFTDYPNYIGAGVLLLALVGFAFRRDRFAWCLLSLSVLATLISLGRHGPLYGLLYDVLPGFNKFRVPVMILILQEFCLVLLAMSGLDQISRRVADATLPRPAWFRREVLAVVALLGLVLLVLGTVGASVLKENSISSWRSQRNIPLSALDAAADIAQADAIRLGLVALLSCVAVAAVSRRRAPAWVLTVVVGALLAWDLMAVCQPLLRPDRHLMDLARTSAGVTAVTPSSLLREPVGSGLPSSDLVEWLKAQGQGVRTWPLGPLGQTNVLSGNQIVSLGGYHAAKLRTYEQVRKRLYEGKPPDVRWANRLAADWIVAPGALDEGTREALRRLGLDVAETASFEGSGGVAYRNRSAQPRFRLVNAFDLEVAGRSNTGAEPPAQVLDRIAARQIADYSRVTLSEEPHPRPAPDARGTAELVEESGHQIVVDVDVSAPTLLVMADTHYPEWSARIDDEPAPLLRADFTQRALAVPAGQHRVTMEYQGSRFHRGRMVSRLCGGLLILGWVVSVLLERRRGPAVQDA